MTATVLEVTVYTDAFNSSSKIWHADVLWDDGKIWRKWQTAFKRRGDAVRAARKGLRSVGFDAPIVSKTGKVLDAGDRLTPYMAA